MDQARSEGSGFFDVITDKQTYLNTILIWMAGYILILMAYKSMACWVSWESAPHLCRKC